jgi:pimeloyl-ACP methyl ester carboxylesterase
MMLLYLVILALLYFNQSRMVFYPDRTLRSVPSDGGMEFEDVEFLSGSQTIHGWYVPGKTGASVVLFCHGNAGNISDRLEILRGIHTSGLGVLIFDYAGYGKSSGSPDEKQMYSDAEAGWDWLISRGISPDRIIVYGRSLGGAVAAHVAAHRTPRVLVLEATFTDLSAVAGRHYPWVPVGWLLKYSYPTEARVREVQAPVIIVHSREDELMPFEMADRLLESTGKRGRLVVSRGGHNTMPNIDWKAVLSGVGEKGKMSEN